MLVVAPLQALSLDLAGLTHRQFSLNESPLFLGAQADANVLILMDDSLSMSSSFTLDHRAADTTVEKTGSGGQRNGGADQAQGMARATDDGRLIYPWLFPVPERFNSAAGTCRDSGLSNAAVNALRLPDEEASPFCAQIPPSKRLLDALASTSWVRSAAGISAAPDQSGDLANVWQLRSASFNAIYFDPNKTYSPWPGVDSAGVAYADANPLAVRLDPYNASSATLNIKSVHQPTSIIRLANGNYDTITHQFFSRSYSCGLLGLFTCTDEVDTRYKVALYYEADGTEVDLTGLANTDATLVNFANWFQYYRSRELVAKGVAASLVEAANGLALAYATIHQNDAIAVPAVSVTTADSLQSGNKRALLDAIYSTEAAATATPLRRALEDAGNYFRCSAATRYASYFSGTETQENQNVVGDSSCPVLAEADGGECQAHNAVLVTDGYSTAHGLTVSHTDYPAETGAQGDSKQSHNTLTPATDHDSDDSSTSDGEPYADGVAGTLADAAMDAYEDDLQPGLEGTQRMHTHALVVSAEAGSGDVDDILAGMGNWPTPLFALPASAPYEPDVSDAFEYAALLTELKHATANGRGQYLSGLGSGGVAQLIAALNEIGGSRLSGTNTTASSTQFDGNTLIFTTSYNFDNWSGNLIAYQLGADGTLTEQWDAASQLTSDSGRVVMTYDPRREASVATGYNSGGIPFTTTALADAQFFGAIPLIGGIGSQLEGVGNSILSLDILGTLLGAVGSALDLLLLPIQPLLDTILSGLNALGLEGLLETIGITDGLSAAEIEYVRGERSGEQQNGGTQRDRTSTVLGPILSSNPVFVGAPNFDYPDEFENPSDIAAKRYHQFALDYADRAPMVYVGANDGMLHGFDATTGEERIAFVPSRVLSNLKDYADTDFAPEAYVDGQISVVDVFGRYPGCGASSPCWRTVLVGSLGRGGQGIYALDVTDPGSYDSSGNYQAGRFSENNAEEVVLWEFTDAGSLSGQLKQLVNDLIQDALCDALLGLCDIGFLDLGNLVENFVGASFVEPLLDVILQTDEERGHAGMGYTFAQPNIVLTAADFGFGSDANATGDWAVLMSNGYNNTEIDLGLQDVDTSLDSTSILSFSVTGNAYAYAIDMETGILVRTFDTKVGAFLDLSQVLLTPGVTVTLPDLVDDSSSLLQTINLPTSVPNGLATMAVVDVENDRSVDYVYSGDLVGNLWKLDLTDTDEANWGFSASSGGDPAALFQATNFSGVPQPITTEPMVMLHPNHPADEGQLVIFGTGEMLEADAVGEVHYTQSIYGIWDKNESTGLNISDKTKYRRRLILDSVNVNIDTDLDGSQESAVIRIVSSDTDDGDSNGQADGPIDWSTTLGWYMDLAEASSVAALATADNQGERVVADPILRNDRLLISTTILDEAICNPAISNWLFELDAADGSPTVLPPFDLNGDGSVTFDDRYDDGDGNLLTPAGRFSDGTYNPVPTILITADGNEIHLTSGADGGIERTVVNPIGYERSRSTWRQLR
jgi:type IV pilus assembly protein PilY1